MLTYSLNIYVLKPYIFPDLANTVSEKIDNLFLNLDRLLVLTSFFLRTPPLNFAYMVESNFRICPAL